MTKILCTGFSAVDLTQDNPIETLYAVLDNVTLVCVRPWDRFNFNKPGQQWEVSPLTRAELPSDAEYIGNYEWPGK
jgi:hypothetical protein